MNWLIEPFLCWFDDWLEAWLKTYSALGDYPDDRLTERGNK
jgi:hypothetical protein